MVIPLLAREPAPRRDAGRQLERTRGERSLPRTPPLRKPIRVRAAEPQPIRSDSRQGAQGAKKMNQDLDSRSFTPFEMTRRE
jgi:hypothetical protein